MDLYAHDFAKLIASPDVCDLMPVGRRLPEVKSCNDICKTVSRGAERIKRCCASRQMISASNMHSNPINATMMLLRF